MISDDMGFADKKVKGVLMCVQCGAAKNLEVSLQDNHSRIYYYICSLGLQSEAPDIWMNPRLNEKCSSCQGSSMVPKAETRCKNDWVFLYLIEALGCLSLEELRRFCVENKEPHDMMEKKRVLFQVYHHLSNKMQEIRPMYTGKNRITYDSPPKSEAPVTQQGFWAYQLPNELLERIIERPTLDIFDVQRCYDVCLSWRSVVKESPSYKNLPPMPSPILLFPNNTSDPSSSYTNATGFYRLGFPFTHRGRFFMYSCRGWLLSVSEGISSRDIQLLNPFTGVTILLPDAPEDFPKPYRFLLSASPSDMDCKMVLFSRSKQEFLFYKLGANIECREGRYKHDGRFRYEDFVYMGGTLCGIRSDGTLNLPYLWPTISANGEYCPRYLVKSSDLNRLLYMVLRPVVWVKINNHTSVYKTIKFEVFKLTKKSKKWKEVTSLGRRKALFLAHNDSQIVPASDPAVCKQDCIYFVDDAMEGYCMSRGKDFGVFDLKTKTFERFQSAPFSRWFKPDV